MRYGGRQKGTPNKITETVKNLIYNSIQDYYQSDTFQQDIKDISPRERLEYFRRLSDYLIPKPKPEDTFMQEPTVKIYEIRAASEDAK